MCSLKKISSCVYDDLINKLYKFINTYCYSELNYFLSLNSILILINLLNNLHNSKF